MDSRFDDLNTIIFDVKEGRPVIVVDNPDRENEGDIFIAAERISEEGIAFMRRYATGLICVPLYPSRLGELGLPLMAPESYKDRNRCRFTCSVDYIRIRDNGMSDYDRATTIREIINPRSVPGDFYKPGHVFPLMAEERGLAARQGHTEAAVALSRAAGLYPAGVICEVVNDDGTMARGKKLFEFGKRHNIKICSIRDMVEKGF